MASVRLRLWVAANKRAHHGLPVITQPWLSVKDQQRAIDGSHASFIGSTLVADKDSFHAETSLANLVP